jgi:hypothetical protein
MSRLVLAWIQSGLSARLPRICRTSRRNDPPVAQGTRARDGRARRAHAVLQRLDQSPAHREPGDRLQRRQHPVVRPRLHQRSLRPARRRRTEGASSRSLGAPPTLSVRSCRASPPTSAFAAEFPSRPVRSISARCDGQHRHPTRAVRRRADRHDDLPPLRRQMDSGRRAASRLVRLPASAHWRARRPAAVDRGLSRPRTGAVRCTAGERLRPPGSRRPRPSATLRAAMEGAAFSLRHSAVRQPFPPLCGKRHGFANNAGVPARPQTAVENLRVES